MDTIERRSVHHVEIGVTGGEKEVRKFTSTFPFEVCAKREGHGVVQWLVQASSPFDKQTSHRAVIQFLFTEITCVICADKDPYATLWFSKQMQKKRLCKNCQRQNNKPSGSEESDSNISSNYCASSSDSRIPSSVYNMALEVKDIPGLLQKLTANQVHVIKETQRHQDDDGFIEVCTIKSIVGNVLHTLINSQHYSGLFMPGFIPYGSDQLCSSDCSEKKVYTFTHIDHFTFACDLGTSSKVIEWYERLFGMRRFKINRQEDDMEGFVVKGEDIGLRMKAMEFWMCAEQGLQCTSTSDLQNFRIVIVEELENQGPNQISTFLREHQGPGIQHIGLHTPDICQCIRQLKEIGVQFAEPPYTYYSEVGRLKDIISVGLDSTELERLGVLIDTEEDDEGIDGHTDSDTKDSKETKYLLQKFTKPLFEEDTFFLEVIQRLGATGFGSGNITALWRSVQAYMNEKEQKFS